MGKVLYPSLVRSGDAVFGALAGSFAVSPEEAHIQPVGAC